MSATYDRIGLDYGEVRRADPRIEARIRAALGDARTVLNLGAGAGSYEPTDRQVIAVEPSAVMIAQRDVGAAPVIQGTAEALPLADGSVEATMGVFTLQHWSDIDQGLREVRRVTRDRAVFLTLDVDVVAEDFWLAREYLPEMIEPDRRDFPSIGWLGETFTDLQVDVVPVPGDCIDGFCLALWNRPEAYLEPRVRQACSIWHRLPGEVVARALGELADDLRSGEWDRRLGHLRRLTELDVGLRLVRAEFGRSPSDPARPGR